MILTLDPAFARTVTSDPSWSGIKAVRGRRVYRAPALPFGWFDAPPGMNRLIGVRWLAKVLYPDLFPEDLQDITRDFYQRFYHVALSVTTTAGEPCGYWLASWRCSCRRQRAPRPPTPRARRTR